MRQERVPGSGMRACERAPTRALRDGFRDSCWMARDTFEAIGTASIPSDEVMRRDKATKEANLDQVSR